MSSLMFDGSPVAAEAIPDTDPDRPYAGLCLHTVTTKPWDIEVAVERYAAAGLGGITIWRDAVEGRDPGHIRTRIRDAGLKI
ncbi:MAG: hypothetical protein ACOC4F_04860, partial [bacterium]